MTKIESDEDITEFFSDRINRAKCSRCQIWMQAPELVTVNVQIGEHTHLKLECIPIELSENPAILDGLVEKIGAGVHIVFSHDELARSLEAHMLVEMRRQIGPWS